MTTKPNTHCDGSGDRKRLPMERLVGRDGQRRARVTCSGCHRDFFVRYAQGEHGWPEATVPNHNAK